MIREQINRRVTLDNFTLGRLLDLNVELFSDDEAIVIDGLRLTWYEFYDKIMQFTSSLHHLGFKKGDKVGIWSQNRYEWLISWFGLLKLGIIIIPIDYWYRPEESRYILNHSDLSCIICTSDYIPQIEKDWKYYPNLHKLILMDDIPQNHADKKDFFSMQQLMMEHADYDEVLLNDLQEKVQKNDVAFILYTSGTTGTPKGAQLSHYSIIKNMIYTSENMKNTHLDKMVIPVPFSHVFGNVVGITLATITGSTMIPLRNQDPGVALKTIRNERATILHGTPTHFIRYIKEKENHPEWDVSSLRTGIIAGAPCPPEVMQGIINVLTMRDIVIGYGMTELSPFCTLTSPDDELHYRINSVGKKMPEMEIKIVDDNNLPVKRGEKGEICVKGYNIMKGYYKSKEKTKKAIDVDGFMHTGDLGVLDDKGYYKIVGRKKDMIIYGGVNIYPVMVEDFLMKHPKILEVAVIGVPDPEYGEVVAAVINRESGLNKQEVVDFCYGKISSPSVPRYVVFNIQFPISGRGKIQKYKLRAVLAKMLEQGDLAPKLVPTKVKKKTC
ncbi:MAG: AMP-binding protein [Promethearchaeota archaeon]|nr:MAG: AMP-binding protein [Candidatus Lokiarchaeota archaeon]